MYAMNECKFKCSTSINICMYEAMNFMWEMKCSDGNIILCLQINSLYSQNRQEIYIWHFLFSLLYVNTQIKFYMYFDFYWDTRGISLMTHFLIFILFFMMHYIWSLISFWPWRDALIFAFVGFCRTLYIRWHIRFLSINNMPLLRLILFIRHKHRPSWP